MENIDEHINVFNGGCHPVYDKCSPEYQVLNPHTLTNILDRLDQLKEEVNNLRQNNYNIIELEEISTLDDLIDKLTTPDIYSDNNKSILQYKIKNKSGFVLQEINKFSSNIEQQNTNITTQYISINNELYSRTIFWNNLDRQPKVKISPINKIDIQAQIQKQGNKNMYIYSEDPKSDKWTASMNNFPPVRTVVTPGSRFIQTNGHIYPEWSIWGGNGVFYNDDGTLKSESICQFKDISTYSRFPVATEIADGVMSASDKQKLNSNQNDIVNFKLIRGAKFKIFLDGEENPFELNNSNLFELRRSSNDNKLYIHSINDSQGSTSVLISHNNSIYWFNVIEKNGYYCLYNESNNKFCAFKKDDKTLGLFTKTSNNTFDKMFSNTLISTYISRFRIELVDEEYTLLQ